VPFVFLKRSPLGCWPSYFISAGFGSNVSTCDGPPFMKRNTTRFARGAKCGDGAAAKSARGPSKLARLNIPKPPHRRWSIWRRLSEGGGSIHIEQFGRGQEQLGVL